MRLVARCKAEQNRAALDPWTVVHLAAGLAAGLVNMPFRWAMAASLAYEVVEQVAERREWGKDLFETAGPESLPNALADTVVFVLGHRLGARWNATGEARHGSAATSAPPPGSATARAALRAGPRLGGPSA